MASPALAIPGILAQTVPREMASVTTMMTVERKPRALKAERYQKRMVPTARMVMITFPIIRSRPKY